MVVISAPCLSDDSRCLARADRLALEEHGARAAQGHPAAVFGAGEAEVVAHDPQQRRVAGDAGSDVDAILVDEDDGHGGSEAEGAASADAELRILAFAQAERGSARGERREACKKRRTSRTWLLERV
jgi:hypothetical protein